MTPQIRRSTSHMINERDKPLNAILINVFQPIVFQHKANESRAWHAVMGTTNITFSDHYVGVTEGNIVIFALTTRAASPSKSCQQRFKGAERLTC